MPPKKSEEKEKFDIRQFKDKSSNWFLNNKHYYLNEKNNLIFIHVLSVCTWLQY
jgi:hypothetical protein